MQHAVSDIFGFPHVLPTHQGRSAELILMTHFLEPGDLVPNNIHFDTTQAHVQYQHAMDLNLVGDVIYDWESEQPFKGNMDVGKLEALLAEHAGKVPLVAAHADLQQRRRPAGEPGEPRRRATRCASATASRCSSTARA